MTSLLSQCLHSSGCATQLCSVSRVHRTALFHGSASVTKGSQKLAAPSKVRGNSQEKSQKSTPPKSSFSRDELPHVGKQPRPDHMPRRQSREEVPSRFRNSREDGRQSKNGPSHLRSGSSRTVARSTGFNRTKERYDLPRVALRRKDEHIGDRKTSRDATSSQGGGGRSVDMGKPSARSSFFRIAGNEQGRRTLQLPSLDGFSDAIDKPRDVSKGTSTWQNRLSSVSFASIDPQENRTFSKSTKPIPVGTYDEPQLQDEFFHPPESVSSISSSSKGKRKSFLDDTLPTTFSSPPLLPGFVTSLKETLGDNAQPTPIQSLSMKHLFNNPSQVSGAPGWRQFLLASETGSGKSIAYLLPLLQHVKESELSAQENPQPTPGPQRLLNPRGIVMAPTHELSRQLSAFAKSLLHEVKLRVLCASQANTRSTSQQRETSARASTMSAMVHAVNGSVSGFEAATMQGAGGKHPVGVVVGTPMKLLEMVRGRGWDAIEESAEKTDEQDEQEQDEDSPVKKVRRGRDKVVHFGKWRAKPELGLANVEWVVVDEADVLFDPDFQETTRALLADISAARGHVLPPSAITLPVPVAPGSPTSTSSDAINYPFNLVLTSATIPKSLNSYLERHHPSLLRLASPRLHHLPKTLQTEYVGWTGGNKFADVMRRIRRIWAEDAASGSKDGLSKVLVFCNKSAKVVEFSAYLAENKIKSVAMTSQSENRGRGSNRHLSGFLRTRDTPPSLPSTTASSQQTTNAKDVDVSAEAHVMVTTSLLSRGLDFAPDIRHVFIVDEPRNTIDFLHRAGRTGRAGAWGKVVVFGKMEGRGSQRAKDTRKKIGLLTAA